MYYHGDRWAAAKVLIIVANRIARGCDVNHKAARLTVCDCLRQLSAGRVRKPSRGSRLLPMPRFMHRLTLCIVICIGSFLPSIAQTASPVTPEQQTKRLILKDGSYQMVSKYDIQGDRIHYFSVERFEWEDLPVSLVDWDATKKYEADLSKGKARVHVETPEEREEREKEEANSPEILPGLRLPGTGGVFLLDEFNGQPELVEILQNGSELNQANKKSVLRTAINPIGSSKHPFELKGPHARIQSHVAAPTIYLDIDQAALTDIPLTDRFRIVRSAAKNDVRVIGNLKVTFSGKASQEGNFIPTRVEKIGTGEWFKVTPERALPPGEYAVVEMLSPQEINLYVWDFGVNAHASANPDTWRPAQPASNTTSK